MLAPFPGPEPAGPHIPHPPQTLDTTHKSLPSKLAAALHSRPRVSNDNPYSESQFKTLKYRPDYPGSFENLQTARAWCRRFFDHYNNHHRHSGIGMLTPAVVHHGLADSVRQARAQVLDAAYAAHPERFIRRPPTPPKLPAPAWINRPPDEEQPDPEPASS